MCVKCWTLKSYTEYFTFPDFFFECIEHVFEGGIHFISLVYSLKFGPSPTWADTDLITTLKAEMYEHNTTLGRALPAHRSPSLHTLRS